METFVKQKSDVDSVSVPVVNKDDRHSDELKKRLSMEFYTEVYVKIMILRQFLFDNNWIYNYLEQLHMIFLTEMKWKKIIFN